MISFEEKFKIKMFIIDEPILIENKLACDVWRKAIWLKALSYSLHYKHNILPVCTNDFYSTHLIVTNEITPNNYEPILMYKTTQHRRVLKYKDQNPLCKLLSELKSKEFNYVEKLFSKSEDLAYSSAVTFNPKYKKKEYASYNQNFKDLLTTIGCNYNKFHNVNSWITIAALKYKIGRYFEYLGCDKILGEFALESSDYEKLQLYIKQDSKQLPFLVQKVINENQKYWDNAFIFKPNKSSKDILHKKVS